MGFFSFLSPQCDLDLEGRKNPTFLRDTPRHDDAPSIPRLVAYSLVVQKVYIYIYVPDKGVTDGQTETQTTRYQYSPPLTSSLRQPDSNTAPH